MCSRRVFLCLWIVGVCGYEKCLLLHFFSVCTSALLPTLQGIKMTMKRGEWDDLLSIHPMVHHNTNCTQFFTWCVAKLQQSTQPVMAVKWTVVLPTKYYIPLEGRGDVKGQPLTIDLLDKCWWPHCDEGRRVAGICRKVENNTKKKNIKLILCNDFSW